MSAQDNNAQENAPSQDSEVQRRMERLATITEKFGNPFHQTKYDKTHSAAQIHDSYTHLEDGERTEDEVSIAGRIMAYRNNGMFMDILDDSGRIQVFHSIKELKVSAPETAEYLKLLDLGDIVGIKGIVRRTPRGEITVNATKFTLLSKAIEPPPEKYHGLKDIETRFRHREQDLVATESSRNALRARFEMTASIREYMNNQDFLEVETPMMHTIAGGAIAKPFNTHHNALDIPLYMRIAPELHLKRIVIGGLSEKIYEINRCFRNEGLSPKHNPEFTTMEVYQAYADYTTMIELTEAVVQHACMKLHGKTKITYGETEIDFTGPWARKSMVDLITEHSGLDLYQHTDPKDAVEQAKKIGVHVDEAYSWGQIVEVVFEEKVEKLLIQPTHVIDMPKDISPLSKAWPDRPHVAQRFETYVNGWEIANAFSELNDPLEQKDRFLEQAEQKRGPDDPPHPIDDDFIKAIAFGMPTMGGLGIGLDRLAMLLTNSTSIREIIAFPTMKPIE